MCPFGPLHCHILDSGGRAFFPAYNASIEFLWLYSYANNGTDARPSTFKNLDREIGTRGFVSSDFVIINFGLWTSQRDSYEMQVQNFAVEVTSLLRNKKTPNIVWQESFPQHFNTTQIAGNGYYDDSAVGTKCCIPVGPSFHEVDWRNRVADSHLSKLLPFIRIAQVLSTQHDAHIDKDSKLVSFNLPDCTHYCAPSGVFEFIKFKIHKAIRKLTVDGR